MRVLRHAQRIQTFYSVITITVSVVMDEYVLCIMDVQIENWGHHVQTIHSVRVIFVQSLMAVLTHSLVQTVNEVLVVDLQRTVTHDFNVAVKRLLRVVLLVPVIILVCLFLVSAPSGFPCSANEECESQSCTAGICG